MDFGPFHIQVINYFFLHVGLSLCLNILISLFSLHVKQTNGNSRIIHGIHQTNQCESMSLLAGTMHRMLIAIFCSITNQQFIACLEPSR